MTFKRALGPFDATMVVVGGIIGSGIFINPYIVAQRLDSPAAVLGAWAAGGAIALAGALAYAELGALAPRAGGQYVYLRDAYHPLAGFLYGWALLAVIETGAIAAVAITFATYALRLAGRPDTPPVPLAIGALVVLSAINYVGVKPGSRVLNVLVVLKVAALGALIGFGAFAAGHPGLVDGGAHDIAARRSAGGGLRRSRSCRSFSRTAAGRTRTTSPRRSRTRDETFRSASWRARAWSSPSTSWSTSSICAPWVSRASRRRPRPPRTRPGGCSGPRAISSSRRRSRSRRSASSTSRSSRRRACITRWRPTALFFPALARLHPRYRTPGVAIVLQTLWSCVLALSGTYGQLLNYVVFADWIFFGMTVATILVFRRTLPLDRRPPQTFRMPAYPVLPVLFALTAACVVASVIWSDPRSATRGALLLAAGIPVFYWFRSRERPTA